MAATRHRLTGTGTVVTVHPCVRNAESLSLRCVACLQAGTDIFIGVTARDANKAVNAAGQDSFFLTAVSGEELVFLPFTALGDGEYVAKFQPTVAGKYSIMIALRTSQSGFANVATVPLKVVPEALSAEKSTLEHGVFTKGTVSVQNTQSYARRPTLARSYAFVVA